MSDDEDEETMRLNKDIPMLDREETKLKKDTAKFMTMFEETVEKDGLANRKVVHSKYIALYKGNFFITDDNSKSNKCYIRFSGGGSQSTTMTNNPKPSYKGILGMGLIVLPKPGKEIDLNPTPIFAMTALTIPEFPSQNVDRVIWFYRNVIVNSFFSFLWIVLWLFRCCKWSLLCDIRKQHKNEFVEYHSIFAYEDPFPTDKNHVQNVTYRFEWEEVRNSEYPVCNIFKTGNENAWAKITIEKKFNATTNPSVGIIDNWSFFPEKGTPEPASYIGRLRRRLYNILDRKRHAGQNSIYIVNQ